MTDSEQHILSEANRHGPAAAVDALLRLRPREAIDACRTLVAHLVNEEHDVATAILVGWAGATHAQRLAQEAPTLHGLNREFTEHARSLFFTLGSLLWPGWGNRDTELDATAKSIGLVCSRRALALTEELAAPEMVRARAHWLVGVHAMFAGDYEGSRSELVAAVRVARDVGSSAEMQLLRAYLLMAQAAAHPDDPEIPYELERFCHAFEQEPETGPFAGQLRTAWSVLAPDRPLPELAPATETSSTPPW